MEATSAIFGHTTDFTFDSTLTLAKRYRKPALILVLGLAIFSSIASLSFGQQTPSSESNYVSGYAFGRSNKPTPTPTPSPTPTPTPSPTPSPTPTPAPIIYGWDSGIKKRCVKTALTSTVLQGLGAPYQDLTDCPSDSSSSWLLGLQSESSYDPSGVCVGFPAINALNSPITFNWLDRGNGTYAPEMRIDFISKAHPCGAGYFNWFNFMDQNPDAIYPVPSKLLTEHVIFYTTDSRSGAGRLTAGMNGFLRTSPTAALESFTIEVGLHVDSNWGDNFPDSPIIAKCTPAECGSNHIFIDGNYFGLFVPTNQETRITIPWHQIYAYLVQTGHIPSPYEPNAPYLATGGVSLGFEVNNFSTENSYSAHLIQADFFVKSL